MAVSKGEEAGVVVCAYGDFTTLILSCNLIPVQTHTHPDLKQISQKCHGLLKRKHRNNVDNKLQSPEQTLVTQIFKKIQYLIPPLYD